MRNENQKMKNCRWSNLKLNYYKPIVVVKSKKKLFSENEIILSKK